MLQDKSRGNIAVLMHQILRRKPILVTPELDGIKRELSMVQVACLGISSTVGTGIFVVLTQNVSKAGPAVVFSFILAAIAAGLSAVCYAEIASTVPASGSTYSYAYSSLGEFMAVIIGACLVLEYAVSTAAVAVGWSQYMNQILEYLNIKQLPSYMTQSLLVSSQGGINLPAIILVIVCGALLMRGASESARVNVIMVCIKLLVLILFIGVGIAAFHISNMHPFMPHGWTGTTAAASGIFFSFIGLDTIATASEEITDPKKHIPRALMLGLSVVVVIYVLVAIAAVGSKKYTTFSNSTTLATILQELTHSTWPSVIFALGAIVSIFSVTLTTLYGQSRIFYAMGKDKIIPAAFGKLNSKTHNPSRSIVVTVIVVACLAAIVPLDKLANMVSVGTLVAFIVVAATVIIMRVRDPEIPRGFTVPLYPITPILSIGFCCYVLSGIPTVTWIAFGCWTGIVVLFYLIWGRKNSALEKETAALL